MYSDFMVTYIFIVCNCYPLYLKPQDFGRRPQKTSPVDRSTGGFIISFALHSVSQNTYFFSHPGVISKDSTPEAAANRTI